MPANLGLPHSLNGAVVQFEPASVNIINADGQAGSNFAIGNVQSGVSTVGWNYICIDGAHCDQSGFANSLIGPAAFPGDYIGIKVPQSGVYTISAVVDCVPPSTTEIAGGAYNADVVTDLIIGRNYSQLNAGLPVGGSAIGYNTGTGTYSPALNRTIPPTTGQFAGCQCLVADRHLVTPYEAALGANYFYKQSVSTTAHLNVGDDICLVLFVDTTHMSSPSTQYVYVDDANLNIVGPINQNIPTVSSGTAMPYQASTYSYTTL